MPLLSFHWLTKPPLCVMVAASAASSHNAREVPRLAGVHALTPVMVEPTHTELADTVTVGKVLLMVVAVELVALAAVQPPALV